MKDELAIDIGRRMKALRLERRWSQENLADAMDMTFQQIQKYEKGQNHLTIWRLLELCQIFNVDWSHFLDPLPQAEVARIEFYRNRTTVELVEAFEGIKDGTTRRTLISLVETLSGKAA
jgi:transcriptional regulator with XRE-family HTH domain